MRSICAISIFLFFWADASAQAKAGFEQYSYIRQGSGNIITPVFHYQANTKWYTEAHYNYEDLQTFSLYAGKTFSADKKIAYAVTPMIGGMVGNMQGGLLALNTNISFKKFYFSSQSQYGISAISRNNNFFFSWSEAGYQPLPWIYAGLSLQHTQFYQCNAQMEPGLLLGFNVGQWSFPVYSFNTFDNDQYFVVGINWEWKKATGKTNHPATLSYNDNTPLQKP